MTEYDFLIKKLVVFSAVLLFSVSASADVKTYRFDIEKQPLAEALVEFSNKTNVAVLYGEGVNAEEFALPLMGEYSAEVALEKILASTGFGYKKVEENVFLIVDQGSAGDVGSENKMSPNRTSTKSRLKNEENVIEEMLVTATKRAKSIQDIPLSIAAMGKETLETRGVSETSDFLLGIAGVNQLDSDGFNNSIVVRGITQSTWYQNKGAGPTIATYFGETPITFAGGYIGAIDIKFWDVERFEMLRGPQGTTFGDAALSGAMRIIPASPKLGDFEASVSGDYSGTSGYGSDNHKIQGVVNLPIYGDELAIRASFYQHEYSGFVRNVAGSNPYSLAVHSAYGSLDSAVDRDDQGRLDTLGGRVAALWQPTDNLSLELTYLHQEEEQNGTPISEAADYESIRTNSHPEQLYRDYRGDISDAEIDLLNLTAQYGVGWGDITASLSSVESNVQYQWGGGARYALPWAWAGDSEFSSVSGEIRFASTLDGPWQFVAGAYYESIEDEWFETVYHIGLPETNFYYPEPLIGLTALSEDKDQVAVFGEVSYQLTDTLTATLGARYYTYDRKSFFTQGGGIQGFGPDETDGGEEFEMKGESGSNFKADLTYQPSDDALVYGAWSQGFRLGRPQRGLPPVCDLDGDGIVDGSDTSIESTRFMKSDFLDSYEIGGKFTLLDGMMTVNTAAYYNKWDDAPVHVYFDCSPAGGHDLNAGQATSMGTELEASIFLGDGVRVDMGVGYVNSEYAEAAPGVGAAKGDSLPNSPDWNANLSAQYDFQLLGFPAYVRLDSFYTGSFYNSTSQLAEGGGYLKVDGTAGLTFKNAQISLYVQNMTDVREVTVPLEPDTTSGLAGGGYMTRPRTIGLRVRLDFGE